MNESPIYIIDFEGSKHTGILEYGLVIIEDNKISETQTQLFRPLKEIPSKETDLHNIRYQDVKNEPSFGEFINFFCQIRKNGPFCAHHAVIENNFLKQYAPYPGNVPDFISDNTVYSWGPWIDTLKLYKYFYPNLESYKLLELISLFQLNNELQIISDYYCPENRKKAHCALFDALASSLLLKHLLSLADFQTNKLEKLIILSASSSYSRSKLNQLLLP